MCKRLFVLTHLVLILSIFLVGLANADQQGLAAWWKLDETAGVTAADSSDNGNDGTLEGDVQWAEGILGGAWEGDGTGDYIRVPHSDSLDLSATITVGGKKIMDLHSATIEVQSKISEGSRFTLVFPAYS